MGGLTTHVLDIANGRTPEGVTITLHAAQDGVFAPIKMLRTNAQGRTDVPFLTADAMRAGRYQLVFEVGPYFAARDTPAFFDRVPVRFTIHRIDEHYHVPLLIAPWGYQSYRGS